MIDVSMMTMNCARAMTASADQRLGLGEVDMVAGTSWPRDGGRSGSGERERRGEGSEGHVTCWERNRRSRNALATTETLESAIAAPAISGLSRPAAASGRAAML